MVQSTAIFADNRLRSSTPPQRRLAAPKDQEDPVPSQPNKAATSSLCTRGILARFEGAVPHLKMGVGLSAKPKFLYLGRFLMDNIEFLRVR